MNHPCQFYTCPENLGGQCFGGGCKSNPMPEPKDNGETTQEADNEGGDK